MLERIRAQRSSLLKSPARAWFIAYWISEVVTVLCLVAFTYQMVRGNYPPTWFIVLVVVLGGVMAVQQYMIGRILDGSGLCVTCGAAECDCQKKRPRRFL